MRFLRYTKTQRNRFVNGFNSLNERRLQWKEFEQRVRLTYKPILEELTLDKFEFNNLYLQSRKDFFPDEGETNQNFIQLKMGIVHIGIAKNKLSSTELLIENGGILSFTQDPQGKVLVVLYPNKSEVLEFNDKYVVYGIYNSPAKLTNFKLLRIIRFYFRFMYATSFVGKYTFVMRVRLMLIRFRVYFDILKFGKALIPGISAMLGTLSDSKDLTSDSGNQS